MCRGNHSTSVQVVGINRPVGMEIFQSKFSSGPFWTHKIKTKEKYISISNIRHLLSAPASIPHIGAVLACLVVESKSNCKFFIVRNFCLIVDWCFQPSRALTRSFKSFTPLTWMYFCYLIPKEPTGEKGKENCIIENKENKKKENQKKIKIEKAQKFDQLNTQGWKQLIRHARTARRPIRTLKESKFRQSKAFRRYEHGWEVPRDFAHALQLDAQKCNNKWRDAVDLEI